MLLYYPNSGPEKENLKRPRLIFKGTNPLDVTLQTVGSSFCKDFCGIGSREKLTMIKKVLKHFPESTKKRRHKAKALVKVYENSLLMGDLFGKYTEAFK